MTTTHDYDAEAAQVARELSLDFAGLEFNVRDLARGMKVEYEHGLRDVRTNVTDDDPTKTAKIALAHLYERHPDGGTQYDYYDALEILEKAPTGAFRGVEARDYWRAHRMSTLVIVCILIIALFSLYIGVTSSGSAMMIITCLVLCFGAAYLAFARFRYNV